MFRIRKDQMDVLGKKQAKDIRRAQIEALGNQGYEIQEDSETGDLLLTDQAGAEVRVTSDATGVTSITSAEGHTHRFVQDERGRLVSILDPGGSQMSFEHDSKNRLTAVRREQGSTHRFRHDDEENLIAIEYPDHTTTRFEYDSLRKITKVTDRNGKSACYEYSGPRLVRVVDWQGNETNYEYDKFDYPTTIQSANGNRHEFKYDPIEQQWKQLHNGTTHAIFQADQEAGSYEVRYADGTWTQFVVDDDKIVEAANEIATIKIDYDEEGRILREDTDGQIVEFLRNEAGSLVGIITPDGDKLDFVRDKDQRVCEIIDWCDERYEFEYEPSGALAAIKYPNRTAVLMRSTPRGLPDSLTITSPRYPQRPLATYRWQNDECDRVAKMINDSESCVYKYDAEGRLVTAISSNPEDTELFELDANGNRVVDTSGSCTFNSLNQLVKRGVQNFHYDDRGNMVSGVCPKGPIQCKYNGRDQLTEVKMASATVRYTYDALGRRLSKEEAGGVVTRYIWAGEQLLAEVKTKTGRKVRRDYLNFPELKLPLAMRRNGECYYLHPGRRAEPLCMTDAMGKVVWKADYSAFGETRIAIEKKRQPWRLCGQYHDEETGLSYVLARYYDPQLGRFLTADPLGLDGGSLNLYSYCDGDPINCIDPTGEIGFLAVIGVIAAGAVIGAAINAGIEIYRQHKAKPDAPFDWGAIGKEAGIGAAVGGVGAGLSLIPGGGFLGAALLGGAVAGVEHCVEAGLREEPIDGKGLAIDVAIGAAIGAVTFGIGGLFVRRAKRLAKAADEAAEIARQAERKAAQEAAKQLTRDSVDDKLARYLLNEAHPVGGAKAKWFKEALGFTQENADDLARQIEFDPSKAVQTAVTEHGTKFNQVIEIVGANGKEIPVTFGWIRNNDGVVRLVTAIPSKR